MTMTLKTCKSIALFFIAACAHINWAKAQNGTQNSAQNESQVPCLSAKSIKAPQLYGIWQVSFSNPPAGLPATAVMLLEKHHEFSDSLSGIVSRDLPPAANNTKGHAAKAALAGDVEDGYVILDESSNNISISGTWNGQLVEASCGREVKGVWKDTSASAPPDAPEVPFTMLKRPGW
jgi:hypothetical protein